MKKLMIFLLIICALLLSSCNYDVLDTTFHFNRAVIKLPDGNVKAGEVESWRDYSDGDQIQVTIDGTTYLVHSTNIVLIDDKK